MSMDVKELIKSFTKSDYAGVVDLHVHSCYSDGTLDFSDIVEQSQRKGLKYISITDHNSLEIYYNNDFQGVEGLTIIPGVEFDVWYYGVFIHILGYGVDVQNKALQSLCTTGKDSKNKFKRFFSTRSPQQVFTAIKAAGGISSFAHPACSWAFNLEHFTNRLKALGLDAVEVFYPYTRHRKIIKFHSDKAPFDIAEKLSLLKTGGTDAHGTIA